MNTRQKKILEFLSRDGEVLVQDLAKRLDVVTMTVRRDLQALEQEGALIRTHGGAVLSNAGIIEFAFLKKNEEHLAEKRAIATRVASMIEPGMTVGLDTGTTCLEVAKAIAGIGNLKVLTTSLAIASALYSRDNIELMLLGGKARRGNPDLTGWLTEENLKHFRLDVAVLGADAADKKGVYTTDEAIAHVSQGLIASAHKAILAADHSKFGKNSFLLHASWQNFHQVVTDAGLSSDKRRWLQQVAKSVLYAEI